jgi:hypothetical protein
MYLSVFTTPRCERAWASCYKFHKCSVLEYTSLTSINQAILSSPSHGSVNAPSPMSEPEQAEEGPIGVNENLSDSQVPSVCDIEIHTNFDTNDPANHSMPFQSCNAHLIYEWTVKQRKKAEEAVVVQSVEELQELVRCFSSFLMTFH